LCDDIWADGVGVVDKLSDVGECWRVECVARPLHYTSIYIHHTLLLPDTILLLLWQWPTAAANREKKKKKHILFKKKKKNLVKYATYG
jgi:hypothetical protein